MPIKGEGFEFVEVKEYEAISCEMNVEQPPVVPVDGIELHENEFDDGNARWSTLKLIQHSKKFPFFDMPLAGINLSGGAWGETMSFDDFIHHCNRVENTDLKHPIILDDQGIICDGWHRVCKAILEGRNTIKATRLNSMPKPDMRYDKSEQ